MHEFHILSLIKKHEGWRNKAYDDATGKAVKAPEGKLTIGYGFNIQDNGLPSSVASYWLSHEYQKWVQPALSRFFPKFEQYSFNRQAALASMMFNLGETRFGGFKKMIHAVRNEDWVEAAREAQDSNWYRQVKTRAIEICDMLLTG